MGLSTDKYYEYDLEEIHNIIFDKDALKNIRIFDKTIELVGIVESFELKRNLFKFLLRNNDGDKVQFLVWDPLIDKVKNCITPNTILHVDAAFAKSRSNLSEGTCDYDLTIMSNTKITALGKILHSDAQVNVDDSVPLVTIEDCINHSGVLKVTGFIKSVIKEISLPNVHINQGCISDCESFKLEIRMPAVCDLTHFKIGSHVRVKGTIKKGQFPYLLLNSKDDIAFESDTIKK